MLWCTGIATEDDITQLLTYFFEDDVDSIGDGEAKDAAREEVLDGGSRLKVRRCGVRILVFRR